MEWAGLWAAGGIGLGGAGGWGLEWIGPTAQAAGDWEWVALALGTGVDWASGWGLEWAGDWNVFHATQKVLLRGS